MTESWKRLDLGGGGLPQANLRLARALRKRRTAYLLRIAFPVGAHRWYLREPIGAIVYCVLALAAAAAWHTSGAARASRRSRRAAAAATPASA